MADAPKSAYALLDLEPKSQLEQDAIAICNHLTNPNFRIAVFGPFNHGKSTLLNAMLGNRALPIDLIPTTGAAITVKYGTDLRSRITLIDGAKIEHSGTEVLKEFAILDSNRQMRSDVVSVEVFCPHPFLNTGVEFLDLPGTNDREEQDNLVRQELLGVDLVVQLLDARKLMTLIERENLRDWLLERGIKTVIFVTNFLNLLDPEEQKEVQNRLRFVAESFRAELPPGFSNLYRVDALPALRARLKGDVAAASSSGLAAFETALQNIVTILKQNIQSVRLPRFQVIASQVQQSLKAKIDIVKFEIQKLDDKNPNSNNIKQRAEQLIKKGFLSSVCQLRHWLDLPNLQNKYQADAAVALAQNKFKTWERDVLKKDLTELRLAIVKWVYQAYEFFQEEPPEDLLIPFPSEPNVTLPPPPSHSDGLSEPSSIAVGSGIGWLLGGPVGAAIVGTMTYLVNESLQKQEDKTFNESDHQQVAKICVEAIDDYLSRFSSQGLTILVEYEKAAEKVICFKVSQEPLEITKKREELWRLESGLEQLNRQIIRTDALTQRHGDAPEVFIISN
ncbi:MAG: dynamin family protein [Stigonema ocellatum SAG 48.90 = DSM 106950]|nr:dynamin family protein [Stigonema ocellatum SAG 48.90 = DSM 106950]